jgi:hypothetical protein
MEGFDNLSDEESKARLTFSKISNTDPTAAQFTASNATALKAQLANAKANSFIQVETDLARTHDQTANVKLYQTRTKDLTGLMTQIERNNMTAVGQLKDDKAVTRRQFEINEWYNYRNQVTENALANLAVVLGLLAVVIFSWKMGFVPSGAFYGIAGVLVVYGGVSSWQRFSYMDEKGQDAILWHRRRFGPATLTPPAKLKCDPLTGELIPETVKLNPCLDAASKKLSRLIETNTQDLENYMRGTTSSKSLCSGGLLMETTA